MKKLWCQNELLKMLPYLAGLLEANRIKYWPDWRTPKVTQGNLIYIQRYDPGNKEILEEVAKHEIIKSAWDERFG